MDNFLPFVLARFYPRFKPKEMALSVLGARQSPVKGIYNLWCIVSGAVFCAAPCALYREMRGGLAAAIWVLLAVYGLGCEIISGFCPLNEDRSEVDAVTKLHGGASALGFTALVLVPLLLALAQLRAGAVRMGVGALVCFLLALAFFCCFIMGEKERFADTVLRYGGLWQRLVLASCYVPLGVWCLMG